MLLPARAAALGGTRSHAEGSGGSPPALHPSVHFPTTEAKSVTGHLSPFQHILLSA